MLSYTAPEAERIPPPVCSPPSFSMMCAHYRGDITPSKKGSNFPEVRGSVGSISCILLIAWFVACGGGSRTPWRAHPPHIYGLVVFTLLTMRKKMFVVLPPPFVQSPCSRTGCVTLFTLVAPILLFFLTGVLPPQKYTSTSKTHVF